MIQLIGRLEILHTVYHFPFYAPHIMHEFQQQAICPRVKYLVVLGLMYPPADTVSLDMDDASTYGAIGLNNTPNLKKPPQPSEMERHPTPLRRRILKANRKPPRHPNPNQQNLPPPTLVNHRSHHQVPNHLRETQGAKEVLREAASESERCIPAM
ncbi:hypothetical protein ASPSYDRAFT_886078 [Aspergillus sydowii CBS 593.65]|uniref:Uncharacterized protein n=1 Tax=Aspergillus sydowii CBS 593.65 TaxID=1036612 RepID=A0A1L9TJP9_9EURO|nr:uncharacterized protein ASPSYDRAFT_886078 [Aspergillus sydowii CBS 593.65]OJJ59632.1 hypothetical protein ASPSYDRAFT_886078 [Aspergillus sydowii CBS 593.65]